MARTTLVIAAVCVTLLSAEVAHAQRFTDNNDGTVTDHQTVFDAGKEKTSR